MSYFVKLARAVFGATAGERVEEERDKGGQLQPKAVADLVVEGGRLRRMIRSDAVALEELCIGQYEISYPDALEAEHLARQLAANLHLYIANKLVRRGGANK